VCGSCASVFAASADSTPRAMAPPVEQAASGGLLGQLDEELSLFV
jgi:hypothetical protein